MWKNLYIKHCPVSHGEEKDINPVYRFVSNKSISIDDFKPKIIKYPKKNYSKIPCKASGTSVFNDYQTIIKLQKRVPPFKNKLIARGEINKNDGRVLINKKNHHITWWIWECPNKCVNVNN